ncbi:CWF19-like protein 2 [Neodiprion lecontei]|uniref:CWF19-like protein 2 n=1 Tax=Neodiprion lecontei TaxID=441921 RepID=A0A6J0BA74_NEOLC|nr:CWF19-like protein 2 [Neodiprion lecontei]
MSWIQFESGREKDAARNALRESRQKILEKAEAEYHKKQIREEQSKLRGDDKWMLPTVEARIKGDKKAAKKRKKAKEKKSKKKKKSRSKSSSSSESSKEEEDEEWVEKIDSIGNKSLPTLTQPEPKILAPAVRDEWMNLPGLFPCVNHNEEKRSKNEEKAAEKRDRASIEQLGKSERELNPYWKNGGTGLPQTEDQSNINKRSMIDAKWLRKSLQRAEEQANDEGRSLEEVAAERWGSLARLQSLIVQAESKSHTASKSRYDPEKGKRQVRNREESAERYYQGRRNRSGSRDSRDSNRHTNSERHKRTSRSKSKERHRDSRKEGHRRERSRSREKYVRQSDSGFHERKLAFKKPSQDEYSNFASTSKLTLSSRSTNWKKPEALKREADKRSKVPPSRSKSMSESEESSDSETKKNEIEEPIMTEAEMNQLGAKIVKCEIMGDDELAAKLKAQLEKAREARKNAPVKRTADREETTVILTKTDSRGMTRPVEPRNEYPESKDPRKKNKKKKVDTHEAGQRVRYFADDDKYSIKEMFQQEKGRSTNEDDAMFTKIASKTMDMDEMFEDKVRFKERDAKEDERDRLQAIKQHEKMTKSLDNCRWCIDSKQMLKHMIVAMGSKVYMSLPSHGSLTTGHCILAPIHHVVCQTQLDEDVWEELQTFRKAITKMFMDQEEDVIFFETSMMHRKFPHMQLECIPMPKEIGDMAPIYFKKALLECESEWSTNKKVIDLSTKNVRRSIPKGLPYFAVDFGMEGGFAHVIEDENMFPKNFAQEIIGGMLDLDRNSWRKPKRENFDQQRSKVIEFAKMWKKYDFTVGDDSN